MSDYEDFLASKVIAAPPAGLADPTNLAGELFDWQADIVRWALIRGRAAIFADCGLGKTFMQLEWAKHLHGRVLVVAPLAVAKQTVSEGAKFGIECEYDRTGESRAQIVTTNYELLDHFDAEDFVGVVLDESSILKAHDGKTRTKLIDKFAQTPFKLCCTATPAPNDHMELGNHCEFLGTMTRGEMLSMFFVHDGGETQKWRLKRHAISDFWLWVSSWAVMLTKPSDIGYNDDGFLVPPVELHQHEVKSTAPLNGMLFAEEARSMTERLAARRESVVSRSERAAEIIAETDEPWIVWCNLNAESEALAKLIPDSVEVRGSSPVDHKESSMLGFSAGLVKVLVTKPSICGFGMNWQHCRNVMFVGLSDSWESYYQAVRRCWRFGQESMVNVHIVTSELEGAVVANIQRKERDAMTMRESMVRHMSATLEGKLQGQTRRFRVEFETDKAEGKGWDLHLGDCVDTLRGMDSDSIHYSLFSPPFASLYTYSASDRDMGNCKGDAEFTKHFGYAVKELYRVTMPGRLVSFHCMNLPTSKAHHGFIGLRDFRGEMIRLFMDAGWIFHSEVCIWKDPVTAMQRTKALGLLHKQIKKDSCMSRQGIPDYLVTLRKPGDNPERVGHTNESFPVSAWQRYASPIWDDIKPGDTLQHRSAREHEDERHICPLQLGVIRRALNLWTNPDDLVLSPFAGIGSEGYVALELGRRFVGIELKRSYWEQACRNLHAATRQTATLF